MVAEKDAAIAAAVAEAERLRAAANKPAQVVEKPVYLTGKSITFFEIGKTTLSEKEKVRLNITAEQIKKSPADKVYHIQGHADPQTGSAARNQKLSEARAKAVYDYLISQAARLQGSGFDRRAVLLARNQPCNHHRIIAG